MRRQAPHTTGITGSNTGPCLLANAADRKVKTEILRFVQDDVLFPACGDVGPQSLARVGLSNATHEGRKLQFFVSLSLSIMITILLSACLTTQPEIGQYPAQHDTLATSDKIHIDGPQPFPIETNAENTNDSTTSLFVFQSGSLLVGQDQMAESIDLPNDSTAVDSLIFAADSSTVDSFAEVKKNESDLDTTIVYSADDIFFRVPERVTVLTGKAAVEYKGMILRAHRIEVDWTADLMSATPTLDTLYTDSTNTEIDTIMTVGQPTFTDGDQTIEGSLLKVNIKTRGGYVENGDTEFDTGIYHGTQIQKVSDKILYVKDGYFTTSMDVPPDYKFTSKQMKMIVGDKVVGRPIVLRFGEVPVFALPFAVFSIQRGRRSGILIPTFGQSGSRGRNLRGFGYYWAASDYWDLETRINFFEKTGLMLSSTMVYKNRDKFNGGISGSIDNQNTGTQGWDVDFRHNQTFSPTMRLNAKGSFMSSGYNRTDVFNANRQLDQRLRSNATLSKNWPDRGSSMSMNVSHEQDLIDKTNSQTLPSMRYSHGLIHFFPSAKQRKSSDKTLLYEPPERRLTPSERIELHSRDDDDEKWYNSLTMSYSTNLRNNRDENLVYNDEGEKELHETWRSGLDHNISFKSPQKVMKYLNINPSISYNEDWLLERKKWSLDEEGDAYSVQERGFFQRRTFNANLNSTTKIYGYFPINRGTVKTVRHVLTPTIGLRYQPDFSDPEFGYYQQLERTVEVEVIDPDIPDTTYQMVTYSDEQDRYAGSILGGTSRTRQLSTTFSLGNLFQMKRVELDDEGEEIESKLDLFTYNLSTSYNFAADSMRFGDLSANFRASPITAKNQIGPLRQLSVDFTTRHSFYQYDVENNRRVNKFYWDRENVSGWNVLRMTSFTTNSRFTISGPSPFASKEIRAESKPDTVQTPRTQEDIRRDINDRFGDRSERFTGSGRTPLSITGNLRYSLSMDNPMQPRENLQIGATLNLKLTKMWSFSYGTTVNLMTKDVASSNLMVTRDLESWEGSFSWRPQGIGQGFYLKIGIKAPMLRDVKLEQRRGSGPLRQF